LSGQGPEPLLRRPCLPLYPEEGMVISWFQFWPKASTSAARRPLSRCHLVLLYCAGGGRQHRNHPPEAIATIWCLTIRGYLPLCSLPRVSLLEASLVHKEPPFPRGANERARSPLPLELRELLVLMHHAHCVTLLSEWPTAPRGHLNGQTVQHLYAYQALGA
jgi:hypothetical protein